MTALASYGWWLFGVLCGFGLAGMFKVGGRYDDE